MTTLYKYGKPHHTFYGIPARDLTDEDVEALGPTLMRDVIASDSYTETTKAERDAEAKRLKEQAEKEAKAQADAAKGDKS